MTQLLALVASGLGRSATAGELVTVGLRLAPVVPGLLSADHRFTPEQLAALSEIILDLRAGNL